MADNRYVPDYLPASIILAFFLFAYFALYVDRKLTALIPSDAAAKEAEKRKKIGGGGKVQTGADQEGEV